MPQPPRPPPPPSSDDAPTPVRREGTAQIGSEASRRSRRSIEEAPGSPDVRRVSHRELMQMLDDRTDELEEVIELSEEDEAPPSRDGPRGATLVSAPRQAGPQARRVSPPVEVVHAEPPAARPRAPTPPPPSRRAPTPPPPTIALDPEGDDAIAASERQIAALRDALDQREQELCALRDELLHRERELTLLRSLRPPPPSKRLVDSPSSAPSSLRSASSRFLGQALESTVQEGWRTAADFVAQFPPGIVMRRLDRHPAVRATYLRLLVGIPERTALRTATEDAGRLLSIAVEAHDCEPDSYVRLFHRTATSNYLDPATIWSFLIDPQLLEVAWKHGDARYPVAQRHVARLVEIGLESGVIEPSAVVDGTTVEMIAECLPADRLGVVLHCMIEAGRNGHPFTDAELLACVPASVLVEHLPLPYVLEGVLVPMSRAAGLVTSIPPAPA